MASPKDRLAMMLAQGLQIGSKGALNAQDNDLKALLQTQAEAAALEKLSHEDKLKIAGEERARNAVKGLAGEYPDRAVGVTGASVGAPPRPASLGLLLTPAQKSAETVAGKGIADYETAGGKPAVEKNLQALKDVETELTQGKRDWYDRNVGGMVSGMPTVMGIIAPKEKARRDKARSAVLDAARKTDSNPTQQQIDATYGITYDPASDDQSNLDRIASTRKQIEQKLGQMEQASQNYHNTGYATFGGIGQPGAPAPASGDEDDAGDMDLYPEKHTAPPALDPATARKARLQELRAKAGKKPGAR